jgi:hypothetical protein
MVGLTFLALGQGANAQNQFSPGFSDPFFLYYGFYLPRQASIAAQPTTVGALNDIAAARQNYAVSDRAGLYNPQPSPFDPSAPGGPDMLAPFQRQGAQRLPRIPQHFANPRVANQQRLPHFNELASRYPTARSGTFINKNTVVRSRFAGGMGGFGGSGSYSGYGAAGLPY